jgi:hypothetical protein
MIRNQSNRIFDYLGRVVITGGLSLVIILLVAGCAADSSPPILYPDAGAPVTAALDGNALLVTNDTSKPVYHIVFPTETLPLIEWVPCWHPVQCPDQTPIPPGDERRIPLRGIIEKETESVTFFWWHMPDDITELPVMVEEFQVPLP